MPLLDPSTIHAYRTGSGPVVVLLHGIGATHYMWDGLSILTGRFELLSCHFPGLGETEAAGGPCEIDDLFDQLAGVLSVLGITRAHMVGSSPGGMVARHFAATRPGYIDRLVSCDTSPALSEGLRDELLTMQGHGLAHEAMARADLMDLAEEIHAPTWSCARAGRTSPCARARISSPAPSRTDNSPPCPERQWTR